MNDRQGSYHRSFVAMRNALRSIIFHNGECYRSLEPRPEDQLCECPICIAKAALENEEDWRFMGWNPERRFSMPRELAMIEAWKHYFKRSGGKATGTSGPLDSMLAQILGVDADSITERDWYVATTVVQWLATNSGRCILADAGYVYQDKDEPAKPEIAKPAPAKTDRPASEGLDLACTGTIVHEGCPVHDLKQNQAVCTGHLAHGEYTTCPVHDTTKR